MKIITSRKNKREITLKDWYVNNKKTFYGVFFLFLIGTIILIVWLILVFIVRY